MPAGFDVGALRNALGHYTTGVTIVTTRTPEAAHTGVTVNSFTSVSLDPPLVLFCLATGSSLRPAFEQASHKDERGEWPPPWERSAIGPRASSRYQRGDSGGEDK